MEPGPVAARAGIEIRVGLATLLGRDQRPGEIPGLGPVTADVARTAVAAQRRGAEWRYAVVDEHGYLELAGVTRRRPDPGRDRGVEPGRVRGGIVELHVPAALLTELAADPTTGGPWAAVIADLAGQYTRRDQLAAALDGKPGARFARGALARHIQIRDRCCCHMGCGRPAARRARPHPRPRRRRPHHPSQHRPQPRTSPLVQDRAGLAATPTRTRPLPVDQPARTDLPHPRRTHPPRPAQTATPRPGPAGAGVDEFTYPDLPILDRHLEKPDPPPPKPPRPPPPPPPDDEPPPF